MSYFRVWLFWTCCAWLGAAATVTAAETAILRQDAPSVLVLVGAPGEAEFSTNFNYQAQLWEIAAKRGGATFRSIGVGETNRTEDLSLFRQTLDVEPKDGLAELWIILIGHGTFDGREARFNLRGPDVTATELADWLKPFRRPLVLVNTASASAPFLNKLSGTNRIIAVSTRSGFEQNYARFGKYLAESISDPEGDLDQDGQTSLLEAFLRASHRVEEFYKNEGRLATEHPLIDDNGDGQGTPADWFRGTRATRKSKEGAAVDGLRARQRHLIPSVEEMAMNPEVRAQRDALELKIEALRLEKASMQESVYFDRLERLLLEIASLKRGVSGLK